MKESDNHKGSSGKGWGAEITRRGFLEKAALSCALFMGTPCMSYHNFKFSKDYSRLVELIKLKDREKPLYVFNDFEKEFDEESYNLNLEYFNDHPGLIRRIREDLGGEEIRWRLDSLMERLLFVPEIREEYAATFENYCHDIIDYVLDKTKLNNPYKKIQTLIRERPQIPDSVVTVFLVHNVAKEFVARYFFYNRRHKKVKIDLTGIVFLGEVGSYTTNIYLRGNGRFEFIRDTYTIWQNSARNPYTALTVPGEETLHIALREHTERAIREQVDFHSVKGREELESIVGDWIAVEEAIVGGVVRALLPYFVRKCVTKFPYSLIKEDIESKSELKKYRHLKKGIEVVGNMGYEKALQMYSNDPMEFKKLLINL